MMGNRSNSGNIIDFGGGTFSVQPNPHNNPINETVASICDPNGELLFYTNGLRVFTADGSLMPNGDSLSTGSWANMLLQQGNGFNVPQGALILPLPGSGHIYYLFHQKGEWDPPNWWNIDYLYYSIINMNLNNGKGAVVTKNNELFRDSLGGGLTAVRHANGRDWWIVTEKRGSNAIHTILFDDQGPGNANIQHIGTINKDIAAYSQRFSPDGTKFVLFKAKYVYGGEIQLETYRFDRCEGLFFGYQDLTFDYDSVVYNAGISISPNSRFCYVSFADRVFQYDLEATDIKSSRKKVAEVDGFLDPWLHQPVYFWMSLLAPDGKIYCAGGNSFFMHVIESPDSEGLGCNFCQHCLQLPEQSNYSMPNYPNFRLGPVPGSLCDSLGMGTDELQASARLEIYPNPARDNIVISLGINNNSKPLELEIMDVTARFTARYRLAPFQNHFSSDISSFRQGLYIVTLKDEGTVIGKGKFMVSGQ